MHRSTNSLFIGMKNLFIAAALAMGLGIAGAADASQLLSNSTFRGLGGYASFYTSDSCSYTNLTLGANQNTTHTTAGGRPTTGDDAHISYASFNWCNGTFSSGSGMAPATISGSLARLSISATIPVYDWSTGQWRTVAVAVSLTADGQGTTFGVNNNSYSYLGFSGHSRYTGWTSTARSSGTIALDGTNPIDAGVADYGDGSIFNANGGTISFLQY